MHSYYCKILNLIRVLIYTVFWYIVHYINIFCGVSYNLYRDANCTVKSGRGALPNSAHFAANASTPIQVESLKQWLPVL
jgi:hypothetical protein